MYPYRPNGRCICLYLYFYTYYGINNWIIVHSGILERVNEQYKGNFTDSDRVIIDALHQKLKKNAKLLSSAKTTDSVIFTESIFPQIFGDTAMESYTESQESYESLFQDKNKYNAIMSALAGVIYREMRNQASS